MVHAYKNNGYDIVLDVNSGSVHVVDDIVFDLIHPVEENLIKRFGSADITAKGAEAVSDEVLLGELLSEVADNFSQYSTEDISDAISDILELRRGEALYTDDVYENYVEEFKERDTVIKALCLNIAHDCNLRCKYCFADEGEYHGRKALMTEEVGKAALDFLIKHSGSRRNLEVDFFGGEPLLNWDVVKKIVE